MDRIIKREVETGCEFTLPDYMGDIKRVLYSDAAAIPTGKFLSDGTVELSGIVNFKVIYADCDGKLTAFTQSADLTVKENTVAEGEVDAVMRAVPSAVSVRVVGPRRVALRSLVSVSLTLSEENDLAVDGDVFGETPRENLETSCESIKVLSSRHFTSGEREYAEEACRLVGVTSDEIEIIATSGRVIVTEALPDNGGVRVRGDIILTSIVRTDEQPPFAVKKEIPFDELISVDGVMPTDHVTATAYLTSESMGIAEDADATVLSANVICELAVSLYDNKEVEIVKDAYLTDYECAGELEELLYVEHIATLSASDDVTHKAKREELGLLSAREVLIVNAFPVLSEKRCETDRVILSGVVRISGVACEISSLGTPLYLPFKSEAPFEISVNSSCHIPEDSELECILSVGEIDCVLDPEYVSFSVSLSAELSALLAQRERRLTSLTVCGEKRIDTPPSVITVYYPDEDETLYEVAKLHHAKIAEVAARNGISVDAAAIDSKATLHSLGIKRVMIP